MLEVISTILLNFVALNLVEAVFSGPARDVGTLDPALMDAGTFVWVWPAGALLAAGGLVAVRPCSRTSRAKCSNERSYVRSASAGNAQAGNSRLVRW